MPVPEHARPPAAGLLAIAALAAVPAHAEQFRYRYRPGQVLRLRGGVAGAMLLGQPGSEPLKTQFRVSVRQTTRVVSVQNGVVTLEVTDTPVSGYLSVLGRKEPYDRTPSKAQVRITERGRFLGRKELSGTREPAADGGEADGPGLVGGAADATFALNFPDRDLKPGDTWDDTVTVGRGPRQQQVRLSSRYVGRETVMGRNCARFAVELSAPAGGTGTAGDEAAASSRVTGSFTVYFDPAAGVEVYSTGSLAVVARGEGGPEAPVAGPLVTATRINTVQSLVLPASRGARR